jgi:hypothetical protein
LMMAVACAPLAAVAVTSMVKAPSLISHAGGPSPDLGLRLIGSPRK